MEIKIFDIFTSSDEEYKCWWGDYYTLRISEDLKTVTRFKQKCFKIPPGIRKRALKDWERRLLNKVHEKS